MSHNRETGVIVVFLIALALVTSWRALSKYLLTLAATIIIGLIGYGAIMMWAGLHHAVS